MTEKVKLVLASNSPRRKELLALGGWEFEVLPAEIDETPLPGEQPRDYVLRMAEEKARAAAVRAAPDALVLGADTAVVDQTPYGEQILGKPADEAGATEMLFQLRGHTHQVYTGIAALRVSDGKLVLDLGISDVPMRDYTDEEIRLYVASGDPLDKAGAYAIQNEAFHPVENLQGCYTNIVGLPICHVARTLHQFGIPVPGEAPKVCRSTFGYRCPIFEDVLQEEDQ